MSKTVYIDGASRNNISEIRLPIDSTQNDFASFYDTDSSTAEPTDIKVGKTAYINGGLTTGIMPVETSITPPSTLTISNTNMTGTCEMEGYVKNPTINIGMDKVIDALTGSGEKATLKAATNINAYQPITISTITPKASMGNSSQINSTSNYSYDRFPSRCISMGDGFFLLSFTSSSAYIKIIPAYLKEDGSFVYGTAIDINSDSYGYDHSLTALRKANNPSTDLALITYCYGSSYQCYGAVLKITKNTTSPSVAVFSNRTIISSTAYSGRFANCACVLSESADKYRVLVGSMYNSNQYPAMNVLEIDGTKGSIAVGTQVYNTGIAVYGDWGGGVAKLCRLNDNKAIYICANNSAYIYASIISISGTTPTFNSWTAVATSNCYNCDYHYIDENHIYILFPYSSYYLTGAGVTITDNTLALTNGAHYLDQYTSYTGGNANGGNYIITLKVGPGQGYIFHPTSSNWYLAVTKLSVTNSYMQQAQVSNAGIAFLNNNYQYFTYSFGGDVDPKTGYIVLCGKNSSSYYPAIAVIKDCSLIDSNGSPIGYSLNSAQSGQNVNIQKFKNNTSSSINPYDMYK